MKKKLLVSFSTGRTSAFMTWWLKKYKSDEYEIIVVLSNVGKEREESLQFANNCDKYLDFNTIWIEPVTHQEHGKATTAKVVTFETAARNGEPFEEMIKKYGLPNHMFRHCTRQLKEVAIRSYAKSIGWSDYETAIGIRSDELDRINFDRAKIDRLIYPLATMKPMRKEDINDWWAKQPFDLELKSYEGNCDLCWKKSLRKLMTILKDKPELADWWIEMEDKYGEFVPPTRPNQTPELPIRMFYGRRSIRDILEEAQSPFSTAIDESKNAPTLFDDIPDLDRSQGCEEACDAFN